MIAKMRRIFLVVMTSGREASLKKLRRLGVVHLEEVEPERGGVFQGETARLMEISAGLEASLLAVHRASKGSEDSSPITTDEAIQISSRIGVILKEREQLREENRLLERELDRIASLGDFDPEDVTLLGENGLELRLYRLSRKEVRRYRHPRAFTVGRDRQGYCVATIMEPGENTPGFTEIPLPKESPGKMQERVEENKKSLLQLSEELHSYGDYARGLRSALVSVEEQLQFQRAADGMGVDGTLSFLSGWIPLRDVPAIKELSEQSGWGTLIRAPAEGENPPTYIRTNRVVKIINPLFKMLDTTPGYGEFDVSFWFLLFFTPFVGMIIGDGGYGALLLLATILTAIVLRKFPDWLRLLLLLSLATVGWGGVTGTWFGSTTLSELPLLRQMTIDSISSFNPLSGKTIMFICYVLGGIHISIAHLRVFVRKFPSPGAFAELGWLSMTVGLFFLVLQLALDAEKYPMPEFAGRLIAGGLVSLVLFGQQKSWRTFFKGVLRGFSGLIITILDSISCFGHIISYIRLYAVGLATIAISQSFNSLAAGASAGGGVGWIVAVVILFLGHSLNIVMAALSVVVHGVRLNMLEFSGHLGMEWSGYRYQPFRERNGYQQ